MRLNLLIGLITKPLVSFFVDRGLTFSQSSLDDHQWHHICITWNGFSGVTQLYVDGVRDDDLQGGGNNPDGLVKGKVTGGGKLNILPWSNWPTHVTDVNLWKNVLSSEEIREASRSCVSKQGNLKKWHDFWPVFKDRVKNRKTPSRCKIPGNKNKATEGLKLEKRATKE